MSSKNIEHLGCCQINVPLLLFVSFSELKMIRQQNQGIYFNLVHLYKWYKCLSKAFSCNGFRYQVRYKVIIYFFIMGYGKADRLLFISSQRIIEWWLIGSGVATWVTGLATPIAIPNSDLKQCYFWDVYYAYSSVRLQESYPALVNLCILYNLYIVISL